MRGLRLSLLLGLLMVGASAFAQTARADGATVHINEFPVFTLRATLDGFTPPRRAAAIVDTITKSGIKEPLTIEARGRDLWIMSGTVRIVRVTAREAQLAGVSPQQLIEEWRGNVTQALQLPALHLEEDSVTLGVGERKLVRLLGSAAREASILALEGQPLDVTRVPGGFQILGRRVGEYTLRIVSGPLQSTLSVRILEPAAKLPERLQTTVMGDPASVLEVTAAAQTAVRQHFQSKPGVQVEVLNTSAAVMPQGTSRTVRVRIRVKGAQGAPIEGDIDVLVRNIAVPFRKESELWYSNKPESLLDYGAVFQRSLRVGQATRLLYHHMNATSEPMTVQVVAYNLSVLPAKVSLLVSDGDPDQDPVRVGLDAGEQFLRAISARRIDLVDAPPRSILTLASRTLQPGETMSGIAYVALQETGAQRLVVRTEAKPAEMNAGLLANTQTQSTSPPPRPFTVNPPVMEDSPFIFQTPYKQLSATFSVGGRSAFVRIGEQAIPSIDANRTLQGNYGVTYSVDARLENPTSEPAMVGLEFEASAGYSGFMAMVNGVIKKLPVIQSKEVVLVESIRLAPGEVRNVRVETIPLSGSSYPVTLTFRSLQPQNRRSLDNVIGQ